MNKKVEVGTILYALDECIMKDSGHKTLTIGKSYKVQKIENDEFCIIDDENDKHWFDIDEDFDNYFKLEGDSNV